MVITTSQVAIGATYTNARRTVYIDGIVTDVESYTTSTRVGRIATATLVLTLPVGGHIQPNAEVEIWDGHDNLMGVRFWGRIPAWSKSISSRGDIMTIKALGWSSLLSYTDRFDLSYQGPIKFSTIFDSMCARRGVPSHRVDAVLDPDGGAEAELGGNPYIDDGIVTIPATQGYFQWGNSMAEEFGYSIYDDCTGTVRLSRVSGAPSGDPVIVFTEGDSIIEASQEYDTEDIVNYWDVNGATYEDDIGRSVPIRSIPESTEGDDLIPVNDGVNYKRHQNSNLTTQQLADFSRRVREIDYLTPQEPIKWSSVAVPNVNPGDVVRVESDTLGTHRDFWLLGVDVSYDEGGLTATYEAWAGGDGFLPTGIDRIVIPIQDTPIHLGDETVSWYAVPSPNGNVSNIEQTWDFTVPPRATAINIVFEVHGSNSQFIGGANEDLSVSRFEIWKLPIVDPEEDRPYSSGSLPVLDENYAQQPDYANDDDEWSPAAITVRGSDEEGQSFQLKLLSGDNPDANLGPQDDFEVRNVYLEVFGTVEPVIIPSED